MTKPTNERWAKTILAVRYEQERPVQYRGRLHVSSLVDDPDWDDEMRWILGEPVVEGPHFGSYDAAEAWCMGAMRDRPLPDPKVAEDVQETQQAPLPDAIRGATWEVLKCGASGLRLPSGALLVPDDAVTSLPDGTRQDGEWLTAGDSCVRRTDRGVALVSRSLESKLVSLDEARLVLAVLAEDVVGTGERNG